MTNLSRAIEDETIAINNGFKLKNTLYMLGTPVNSTGVSNLRKSREDYDKLSSVKEECEKIKKIVKEEERSDDEVILSSYRMIPNGQLSLQEITEKSGYVYYVPTPLSLSQLIKRTVPAAEHDRNAISSAASFVGNEYSPINLRQTVTNHYLSLAKTDKKDITAIFRSRKYLNKRELYAVVSDRFSLDCDVDDISDILARLEGESKAISMYDGNRFRFDIIYHTDIKPEDGVCGEVFKAGVSVRSSDNGTQGIRISPFVIRNLCLNLIILDKAQQYTAFTHLKKNLPEVINEAIKDSLNKVSAFKDKWSYANKTIIEELDKPEELFTKLVKDGVFKVPGISSKELVIKLMSSWSKEPGNTLSSIINASSRAAHEEISDVWSSTLLEEQSGNLLWV